MDNLKNLGKLSRYKAKTRNDGNRINTYLGIDEKLPWIVGAKNPIRA